MDIRKTFGTDTKLEMDGVWNEIGEGASLLLARLGNTKYQQVFQRLMRPHRSADQRGTLSDEIRRGILDQTLAETVLLDWKGIQIDGVLTTYSIEAGKKALSIKDFRELVVELANVHEQYRAEEIEGSEKNSRTPSGTTSGGASTKKG